MSDDDNEEGVADRGRSLAEERYEPDYFARKHGLPMEVARDLMATYGNNGAVLDAEAEKFKLLRAQ